MKRCKNCKDAINEINFALGKEWIHVDPRASFPTIGKGTAWTYCKLKVAEPEADVVEETAA